MNRLGRFSFFFVCEQRHDRLFLMRAHGYLYVSTPDVAVAVCINSVCL